MLDGIGDVNEQEAEGALQFTIDVLDAEGKKYKGVLKEVNGNTFTVTTKEKMKVEGKKRPVIADVDRNFEMDKVKYTKYIISFK